MKVDILQAMTIFYFLTDGYDEIPSYHQSSVVGNQYYINQQHPFNSHRQNHYETSL